MSRGGMAREALGRLMHAFCGSTKVTVPKEFGKPCRCDGCGERFSPIELAYERYVVPEEDE